MREDIRSRTVSTLAVMISAGVVPCTVPSMFAVMEHVSCMMARSRGSQLYGLALIHVQGTLKSRSADSVVREVGVSSLKYGVPVTLVTFL